MEDFNVIWLDVIALLVILVFLLKDMRKGFIRTIFGLIISVVSILVAFLCADIVTDITNGAFGLRDNVTGSLSATFSSWGLNFDISQGGVQEALNSKPFFKAMPFLVDMIMEKLPTAEPDAVVYLNDHLASVVGGFTTNIIVGVALFILCRLLLTVVEKILTSLVRNIVFLGSINALLGAVVGLLKGVIVVSLFCMLLTALPMFGGLMEQMPQTLFVYDLFFVNNPLAVILAKFM